MYQKMKNWLIHIIIIIRNSISFLEGTLSKDSIGRKTYKAHNYKIISLIGVKLKQLMALKIY